jgi:hypothetical protein
MGVVNRFAFNVEDKAFEKDNLIAIFNYLREQYNLDASEDVINIENKLSVCYRNDNKTFTVNKEAGAVDETIDNVNSFTEYKEIDKKGNPSLHEEYYFDRDEKLILAIVESFDEYTQEEKTVGGIPTIVGILNKNKFLKRNAGFRMNDKPIILREDDYSMLNSLCAGDINIEHPLIFTKKLDDNLREACKKFQGLATVFVDDDEDLYEAVLNSDCKTKDKTLGLLDEDYIIVTKEYGGLLVMKGDDLDDAINAVLHFYSRRYDKEERTAQVGRYNTDMAQYRRFSTMVQALKDKTEHVEKENTRLKKQIAESVVKTANGGSPLYIEKQEVGLKNNVLLAFKTDELYNGEVLDMLMDSIKEYRKNYVKDDTRRAEILDSFIKNNNSNGIIQKKRKEVDEKMKDFDNGSSPKSRRILEELGFEVKLGSHLKIFWQKNKNYWLAVGSSPSDRNASKVVANKIKEKFL